MELMARCLVYSLIITSATVLVVVVFTRDLREILRVATFALLGEGGLALVVGGVVASFSPAIGKIGEVIFRTEPWDARRQRETEGTARIWIATGVFLFLFGLLASAL
jgi:hypothetical protein